MTTTSFQMKRQAIVCRLLPALLTIVILSACNKTNEFKNKNKPGSYPADVINKWITLQVRLMRNATGIPNQAFSRPYAYAGIAALESLAPTLPASSQWTKKWSSLTGLPPANHSVHYYYPANVNAALASINKAFFTNASNTDKAAIDSLEHALNNSFLTNSDNATLTASAQYGKAVATAVFNWSETDGYKNAGAAYTAPSGLGLWVPTAPAFANPTSPYWGNNRPIITGSTTNSKPAAPMAYSADPKSSFYEMAKQVYDVSQNLTDEQKAIALHWRDVPGVTSPGHWLNILEQVLHQTDASVEKAALAYALTGAVINDALISCWKTKYEYNLMRPITYIRNIMGHTTWTSYLTTPAHPEFASAHAVLSSAAADAFQRLFGNIGLFTDHTYDYLGFAPRSYSSLTAIGEEAAQSRLYAGIHYQPSIDAGIIQGRKVASNIFSVESSSK